MNETKSKTAKDEFESVVISVEAADAAFEYAAQMESVLSDLHTATRQSYGQYCGLARALEIVGERWALLVVRDLLVGPRSFTELHRGLPRMPAGVLSTRLAELVGNGIIRSRGTGDTDVYELTEYGQELEDIVLALGRWGVAALGTPKATDIVTADSVVMAMRASFRLAAATGHRVSYELRLPDFVIHAVVDDGTLEVSEGPLPRADLVIEPGRALKALMTGEVSPVQVLAEGSVRVTGNPDLLTLFVQLFRV